MDLYPYCRVPLSPIDGVLWFTEAIQFNRSNVLIVDHRVCNTCVLFRKLSLLQISSRLFSIFSFIRLCVSVFQIQRGYLTGVIQGGGLNLPGK